MKSLRPVKEKVSSWYKNAVYKPYAYYVHLPEDRQQMIKGVLKAAYQFILCHLG